MDKRPPCGWTDLGSESLWQRGLLHSLPACVKHALDTQCSSLQTLRLLAAANGLSGPGSQGVEVTSEAPCTHERHDLMEHPVVTETFSICVCLTWQPLLPCGW